MTALPLDRLVALRYLSIGSNGVRSIDLRAQRELEFLDLRLPFAKPPDIAKLAKLRTFVWSGRTLVDASPLLALPELRFVSIVHHCIPEAATNELVRALEAKHVEVTIALPSPDC